MKKYIYRLNFRFIFYTLSTLLFSSAVFFIIYFLSDKYKTSSSSGIFMKVSLVFFGPAIVLFFEYLFYSIGTKIEIIGNNVKIIKYKKVFEYEYNQVKNVTKFCSLSKSRNNTFSLPTDSFYFLKIEMYDDKVFIITSLMTDLKNFQFKINKTEGFFIPSIIYIG